MNKVKTLAYTTLAVAGLGLGLLNPNYAMAQKQDKDDGISFYEHKDLNNNGKVDSGETSKLARIVFEEGENITIDSKFKSGEGNLYVISEKGEIVKTIPQQYDTGSKTSNLLEGLPLGRYTTVFQKEGSNELNGSFMAITPKNYSGKVEFNNKSTDFLEKVESKNKKNYQIVCQEWNDLTKDSQVQKWEISQLGKIEAGDSPSIVYRGFIPSKLMVSLKKKKDKSFKKFFDIQSGARKHAVESELPKLSAGVYKLKINDKSFKNFKVE